MDYCEGRTYPGKTHTHTPVRSPSVCCCVRRAAPTEGTGRGTAPASGWTVAVTTGPGWPGPPPGAPTRCDAT